MHLCLVFTSRSRNDDDGDDDDEWVYNRRVYAGVNANCRLTLSKELGDVIFEHCGEDRSSSPTYLELLSLAHDVYSDVSAHVEAMTCRMKQGRVSDAMQYAIFTEHCTQRHLVDVTYLFFFFFLFLFFFFFFFFSGMQD